jgi:hypothetical protein
MERYLDADVRERVLDVVSRLPDGSSRKMTLWLGAGSSGKSLFTPLNTQYAIALPSLESARIDDRLLRHVSGSDTSVRRCVQVDDPQFKHKLFLRYKNSFETQLVLQSSL